MKNSRRTWTSGLCLGHAVALVLAGVSAGAQGATDCAGLVTVSTADATMTAATLVSPPATIGGQQRKLRGVPENGLSAVLSAKGGITASLLKAVVRS